RQLELLPQIALDALDFGLVQEALPSSALLICPNMRARPVVLAICPPWCKPDLRPLAAAALRPIGRLDTP
ncbi:MAG: hypothetical protein WD034_08745, partial [Parvibaculum sp.]